MTKPSRSLANGRETSIGGSLVPESAESSAEADHHLGVHGAVGADRDCGIGIAAADRLDAKLDRGRAGGARGGQRNRSTARADLFGDALGDEAEQRMLEAVVIVLPPRRRDHAVIGVAVDRLRAVEKLAAIGPLQFRRRQRRVHRAGKIAGLADASVGDGFLGGEDRGAHGDVHGCVVVLPEIINGAGDDGAHVLGREAADLLDARAPGGKPGPRVGDALPEGGNHAVAGDGDDGRPR